jgi:glutamine cyclotransferase
MMSRVPAVVAGLALTVSCGGTAQSSSPTISGYRVIKTYQHDAGAFTQGLFFLDGFLYEGTGLNGQSSLRRVRLETGEVLQQHPLPSQYFGEGIAPWDDQILQLTWRSKIGFVYKRATFEMLRSFTYPWEGWGLTQDGHQLIMSDGTDTLHFLDPAKLTEIRRVLVRDNGAIVRRVNELEFIKGEVWANIWQTERIARIKPDTGEVAGWIDLTGLLSADDRALGANEMNGIAYDNASGRIFVTGKNWPKLFEIELIPSTR